MPDQKLTELLTADLPLQSADEFYVVQQTTSLGTSRSITFSDLSAQIAQATTIAASNVIFNDISGATFHTDQDFADTMGSSGALAQGTHYISDAGGGNINVAAGSGLIRTGNTPTSPILFFDWAASNGLAIPSNTTRYVGIDYNAGSPAVVVHTTNDFDGHDNFALGSVVNEAGTLHINHDPIELADFFDHAIKRWYQTHPLARDERQAGLIIGDVGTRNFSITAGTLWDRLNEFPIAALSTNVSGTFDRYYRDGAGGFTKEAAQTQWGNTQYDDGTGTLATLAGGRWANVWWYLENDGDIVMLYGRNTWGNLAAAATESPPATVPARITDAGLLVGRFIFQKSAGVAAVVDSVFTTVFNLTAATDHAALSNLAWTSSGHTGTASKVPAFNGSGAASEIADPSVAAITTIIDGAGSVISAGVKGDLRVPFAATITKATLLADQSGSIVVDIWKDTFANYPPTVADKITSATPPTLSSAAAVEDSTLSGWTTAISAGDTMRFNVNSTSTSITRVTLVLDVTRS